MGKRIVVLGGGVGGLSAAHELADRGFEVHVYERGPVVGGKARSQPLPGTGTDGRRDLPGEHGFRFYPRFYRHLIDTMRRTPMPGTSGTVADNLRDTTEAAVAPTTADGIHRFYRRFPARPMTVAETVELMFADMDVDAADVALFSFRVLQFFTSCHERRLREYEPMSWWEFLRGDLYSPEFQKYLAAVPRTMVAMNARVGSARTLGTISMQLLLDFATSGVNNDRTMNGPTSEVWIDPWREHLASLGVTFHLERPVTAIEVDGGRIAGVRVDGEPDLVTGDHYVAAVPIDVMHGLVTPELAALDPALRALKAADLDALLAWMTGAQYFLYEDVEVVPGHVFYPDSPWALTSISQPQFWREGGLFRTRYGNGEVGGLISVDVSEWETAGELTGKPAVLCTESEVLDEVWDHLKRALNHPDRPILRDDNLHTAHLDDDIVYDGAPPATNRSPLLVHPPGSWASRPEAVTAIPNLVLASDYVRTHTDLATMETANEAARRAVNGILDREGSSSRRADIWPLEEPEEFAWARELDRQRLSEGRPHLLDTGPAGAVYKLGPLARRAAEAIGLDHLDARLDELRVTRAVEWALKKLGVARRAFPVARRL